SGEKFLLFFSRMSEFSNHHPAQFFDDKLRIDFKCSEQRYMYCKAAFFGDYVRARAILREDNPGKMKTLGSNIVGFRRIKWNEVSSGVMLEWLRMKFGQNH
ncbi:hypothetical protein PFISCL1PPCAC_3608, partial [Pristionchus fissidentatus]